ncbi:hypothetical protein CFIMG_007718RA00001 [Ceratocystis fimbriata CBS 114723]|uniref:Uncharacterized protein n=1 Tax=Ceratocystis fimbriata CBS 114723 TaxID=1035309 RepID=A0A2C5W3V3_9PEZI|nr:hypothetical protein CFIMG_007718RA00001 [Ceratocystis fimbriata CBS 114723]
MVQHINGNLGGPVGRSVGITLLTFAPSSIEDDPVHSDLCTVISANISPANPSKKTPASAPETHAEARGKSNDT